MVETGESIHVEIADDQTKNEAKTIQVEDIGGFDLQQHLNVFNQIISNLLRLEVEILDEDKACVLLCSFPFSYKHLVTTLTHGKDLIGLEAITAALTSHSQWRKNVVGSLQGNGLYVKGKHERERTYGKGSSGRHRKKSKSRKCKKEKSVTKATKMGISRGIAQS